MGENLNETEQAFMFWLYIHNPGWFVGDENMKERIPAERLDQIRGATKTEFLEAFTVLKAEVGAR